MMKSGNYYVGDLCYVMHPQWEEFCEKTCSGDDMTEGEIVLDNGVKILQFGTAWGDGCYEDQFGNSYGVDAGLIGCIRIEDINDPNADLEGGNIINFPFDFKGESEDGIIYIGHIRINTDPDCYVEDESEEEENDDEY